MGTRGFSAAGIVLAAAACSPARNWPPGGESLYLMNQTHETLRLSRYRGQELDCVAIARDPAVALRSVSFAFEGCLTLAPAAIVSLDPEQYRKIPPECDAVALEGQGLEPHALFWTDTGYDDWDRRTEDDVQLGLVSVGARLVLEPAANAYIARIDGLPENLCEWAP